MTEHIGNTDYFLLRCNTKESVYQSIYIHMYKPNRSLVAHLVHACIGDTHTSG